MAGLEINFRHFYTIQLILGCKPIHCPKLFFIYYSLTPFVQKNHFYFIKWRWVPVLHFLLYFLSVSSATVEIFNEIIVSCRLKRGKYIILKHFALFLIFLCLVPYFSRTEKCYWALYGTVLYYFLLLNDTFLFNPLPIILNITSDSSLMRDSELCLST
jgi:hypothetical protein